MLNFCEGLADVVFRLTGIVMRYPLIGIGAAIAVTVGRSGLSVLINLAKLILTLYGAMAVLVLFVLIPVDAERAQPKRIRKVDRVAVGIPVQVEPPQARSDLPGCIRPVGASVVLRGAASSLVLSL